MLTITAIFEDGVLKPAQPLQLPEHTQVRITIEHMLSDVRMDEKLAALDNLRRMSKVHSGEHLTRDELHERR